MAMSISKPVASTAGKSLVLLKMDCALIYFQQPADKQRDRRVELS